MSSLQYLITSTTNTIACLRPASIFVRIKSKILPSLTTERKHLPTSSTFTRWTSQAPALQVLLAVVVAVVAVYREHHQHRPYQVSRYSCSFIQQKTSIEKGTSIVTVVATHKDIKKRNSTKTVPKRPPHKAIQKEWSSY